MLVSGIEPSSVIFDKLNVLFLNECPFDYMAVAVSGMVERS